MYPAKFDYYQATSVDEVLSLLQQHGEDAKILAGGHSLIPMMKLRLASPAVLVDIGQVADLRGFSTVADGSLRIGAMTTYHEIADANTGLDALTEVCSIMGDLQVRNRGTIGGNLSHNDPAADLPAVALALDAQLEIRGPSGERLAPMEEFIVGLMETALAPGDLVVAVRFPPSGPASGSAYEKFENPASGYAICGVAAWVRRDGTGRIESCRVALTGAADYAQRLRPVEEAMMGQQAGSEGIDAAAAKAGEGLQFLSDIHADDVYRAHLTHVLTRRVLQKAIERAQ
ncbi:MAG: xanthine dehydrogenase family protein subunit M [Ardenticatenales bacterium]|nr:xanthine dehydrogenase family protein subunit M [Ardenticatenales bacterium]